jgi:hypothetical protein
MSLSSRTNSGPIRFSGGLSKVTRQHAGEDRLSRICAFFVVAFTRVSHGNYKQGVRIVRSAAEARYSPMVYASRPSP